MKCLELELLEIYKATLEYGEVGLISFHLRMTPCYERKGSCGGRGVNLLGSNYNDSQSDYYFPNMHFQSLYW